MQKVAVKGNARTGAGRQWAQKCDCRPEAKSGAGNSRCSGSSALRVVRVGICGGSGRIIETVKGVVPSGVFDTGRAECLPEIFGNLCPAGVNRTGVPGAFAVTISQGTFDEYVFILDDFEYFKQSYLFRRTRKHVATVALVDRFDYVRPGKLLEYFRKITTRDTFGFCDCGGGDRQLREVTDHVHQAVQRIGDGF